MYSHQRMPTNIIQKWLKVFEFQEQRNGYFHLFTTSIETESFNYTHICWLQMRETFGKCSKITKQTLLKNGNMFNTRLSHLISATLSQEEKVPIKAGKSTSRPIFLKWCHRQSKKAAMEINPFHVNAPPLNSIRLFNLKPKYIRTYLVRSEGQHRPFQRG